MYENEGVYRKKEQKKKKKIRLSEEISKFIYIAKKICIIIANIEQNKIKRYENL